MTIKIDDRVIHKDEGRGRVIGISTLGTFVSIILDSGMTTIWESKELKVVREPVLNDEKNPNFTFRQKREGV